MYKIAICDDEIVFAEELEKWVSSYFSNVDAECEIDIYYTGEDFIKNLSMPFQYQIVFLDINMKQMNGIETASILRGYSETAVLIFVTAYIQYTIAGYQVEALRYILKDDVNIQALLKEALDAACKKISTREEKVSISFIDCILTVNRDDIIYIECDHHQIIFYIHTTEGAESHRIRATMDEALEYMDMNTVRTHQSFAINLKYCNKVSYYQADLDYGIVIPVSRTYTKQAREKFYRYKGRI